MAQRMTIASIGTVSSPRIVTNGYSSKRSTAAYPSDIRTSSLVQPVHVAEYLYRRLYEIGIRSIHGVAGEHNLALLDFLEHCGLSWVGNCNELNAGFAADGYARIKGTSALFTTYGAGELSALNAIAGAYAEYVPIIHLVGMPPTSSQQSDFQMHHMLGNGNPNTFTDMARSISCAVVKLDDISTIADQIDHAIRECRLHSRPVYMYLPSDMTQAMVEGERLNTRLDVTLPRNDPEREEYVADVILRYLQSATSPVILVDACALRFRARMEIHDLVERSKLPTFVTPMAKGVVSEGLPNYCGVYAGDGSDDEVRERIEAADLVLNIGTMKSNFKASAFTYRTSDLSTIDINHNLIRVRFSEYSDLRIAGVLRRLSDRIDTPSIVPGPNPQNLVPFYARRDNDDITHAWFWPNFGRWLQPNDIIVVGTGTSTYGLWETRFPPNVTTIAQTLWSSPGYATPACLGAALAAQEIARKTNRRHRVILITGDGGFQSSAQELSTMIRLGLQPVVFLINNEGHSTNRLLHRPDATYNNIQPWKYTDLLSTFGGQHDQIRSHSISTRNHLQTLFSDTTFSSADIFQFVELIMDKNDGPRILLKNTPTTLNIPLPSTFPSSPLSPLTPGIPPLPTSPALSLGFVPPPTPQSPAFGPASPSPAYPPPPIPESKPEREKKSVSRKSSFFSLRPKSSASNLIRPKSSAASLARPKSSGSTIRPGSSSTVQTMATARSRV